MPGLKVIAHEDFLALRKGGAAWCVMHQGATREKSRLHLGFFAGMMAACRFAVGGVAFLCSHFLLSV